MGAIQSKIKYKSDWNLLPLIEVCSKITDGVHFKPDYTKTGVAFISVKDIKNGAVNFESCKFISNEAHLELIKRCFPEKGDVLITKSGTIGRLAIVPNSPEFSLFVSVALIKNIKELVDSKFLMFYLENYINHINISQDIKGGLLKNFHLEDLRKILIPKLPLENQQLIVSKIEELFSELDKGVEELKTALAQLKVYRQSVLKWAFEGKLTNENVKDGELPEGWEWKTLKSCSSLITKGASPKWQGINYTDDKNQVLFVTSENVRENYLDISKPKYLELSFNKKQKRSVLNQGDILINIVGASIGRACIFTLKKNANINQAVSVVRLNKEFDSKFISHFLNSNKAFSFYNQNKVDVARANLSLMDIGNIALNIPNINEQHQIVQEIESRLSVADKLEETITSNLKQAESLKQSILKKAFEGELV